MNSKGTTQALFDIHNDSGGGGDDGGGGSGNFDECTMFELKFGNRWKSFVSMHRTIWSQC